METSDKLVDDLKAFLRGRKKKPYWVIRKNLPSYDFNREIIEPGIHKTFPDGVVGVRVDDDFWAVAALPYRFVDLPLPDIVKTIWPDLVEKARYEPDSDIHSPPDESEDD